MSSESEGSPESEAIEYLRNIYDSENTPVYPQVPASRYMRSGPQMFRMAKQYESDGDILKAYALYIKFTKMFVDKIPSHPGYKLLTLEEKSSCKSLMKRSVESAENVRNQLLAQLTETFRTRRAEEKKRALEREEAERRDRELRDAEEERRRFARVSLPPTPLPPLKPSKPAAPSAPPFLGDSHSTSSSLRTVFIAHDLVQKFVKTVVQNTLQNIETCGILAGSLSNDRFRLTHVLIPKQKGTSDSCDSLDDLAVFIEQERLSLICLGWIHTHPTQTAFLSSIDMHNQYSYQCLLAEALAIVVSHKFDQVRNLVLTRDLGMKTIGACGRGGHHDHSQLGGVALFEDATHVTVDHALAATVGDLR